MRIPWLLFSSVAFVALGTSAPALAQPANDNFANRLTISSTPYTNSQDTSSATVEPDEQTEMCGGEGGSIWYRYTPSGTGTVIADTNGSSFDTVLTVFTGSSLSNLVAYACNDDWGSLQSYMPFHVQSGTTYYIRVNGYNGARGSVVFHLSSRVQPQFTQCPRVGRASGCEYLITAESDGDIVFAEDPIQPSYSNLLYNGRLIGVRNQSGAPLCAVNINATNAFNAPTPPLGICSADTNPPPSGCPFGPTEYEGPGVTLEEITNNFGTIRFNPCIANNGTAYFSVAGSSGVTGTIYTCAEDEICGPDTDGDGFINDFDNCPSSPNADQANLDGDTQGDICDPADNQLVVKSGSIKQKSSGRSVVVKGSIFQSETIMDAPDAAAGFGVTIHDFTSTYYDVDLTTETCIETATKITCEAPDGTTSLQIKTGGLAVGRVPFTLKMRGPETEAPPAFGPQLELVMDEPATFIDRYGLATECESTATKMTCR
ncbi:MAG TPA: thrombospondin type 3 repeat-containing protein [Candidatus Binatia bacterium]|nr:thrombospondin type 3 repeat-containing protein [Candidatus Binatia bacterium]